MADEPFYLKLLTRLGFNTTKLRWKLYQLEKKAQQTKSSPVPTGLKWLQYEHKICRHCGAVNDRASKTCHRCERRMPSVLGYRLSRIAGSILPAGAPVTSTLFIAVIVMFYAAGMLLEGVSSLWQGPSNQALFLFGAFSNSLGEEGQVWWRWLAFSLAHGGILHIGFNVYATLQIGPIIENQIGRNRMLVVITGCQIAAAVATYAWYEQVQQSGFFTIGASGWVFGLIGYGVAYFHRMGAPGKQYRDALMRWVIFGVIFGIIIRANNAAHIGGALGGVLLAYLPEGRGHKKSDLEEKLWNTAATACLAVWLVTIAFTLWFAATNLDILQD